FRPKSSEEPVRVLRAQEKTESGRRRDVHSPGPIGQIEQCLLAVRETKPSGLIAWQTRSHRSTRGTQIGGGRQIDAPRPVDDERVGGNEAAVPVATNL